MWQRVTWGEKCHYASDILFFLIAPCLVFFVILFYIERNKWQRNLAAILPFKSKLSGKFQSFNAIDISIEMLKNSWIFNNFK